VGTAYARSTLLADQQNEKNIAARIAHVNKCAEDTSAVTQLWKLGDLQRREVQVTHMMQETASQTRQVWRIGDGE
jgi:hypothetical protein